MKKTIPFIFLLAIAILFANSCKKNNKDGLFQLLDASRTGIDFSNDLNGTDSLIALSFEYLFNGAGVAIGDFNNDNLPDVFLTGNMNPSALYLNRGDLKFEDVTKASQINTKGKWASGAVTVDINQDGWLDIYICVGGLSTDKKKAIQSIIYQSKRWLFQRRSKKLRLR